MSETVRLIRICKKIKREGADAMRPPRFVDPVDISRNPPRNPRSFRFLIVTKQLPNDKVIRFQRNMYGRALTLELL